MALVIAAIAIIALIFIIKILKFVGSQSGATIYAAQAKATMDSGKSPQEAVLNGLQLLTTRKPFSDLTEDDTHFLAQVSGKLGDPVLLCELLVESDKKASITNLQDRKTMLAFATFVMRERKAGGKDV